MSNIAYQTQCCKAQTRQYDKDKEVLVNVVVIRPGETNEIVRILYHFLMSNSVDFQFFSNSVFIEIQSAPGDLNMSPIS